MKILHIIPAYKPAYIYGGPTISASVLCESLAKSGIDITVLATNANGSNDFIANNEKPVMVDGVLTYYFKRITGDHTHISPLLWRYLYRNIDKYDTIILASWWSPLILGCAFICRLKKRKFVLITHGMFSRYTLEQSLLNIKKIFHDTIGNFLLKNASIHFTSRAEIDSAGLRFKCSYYILPNIYIAKQVAASEVTPSSNCFTIGSFSRIHPVKRIDLLMKACSLLKFNWKLKIAGTGDINYLNELKRLSVTLKISENIEWVGWLDDTTKNTFLQSINVMALVSYSENFANSVLDAVVAGTPVIVTKEVGLSDWVSQHQTGIVVESNTESIASALEKMYENRTAFDCSNGKGYDVVHHSFNPTLLTEQYIAQYKLIGK